MSNWGYFVIASNTGLVVRAGRREEAADWLAGDGIFVDGFDEAMEVLNRDGWHHSFHETEEEALALARDGVYCHGKRYYA